MTRYTIESLVTGTSMLRAGLLALFLISISHPTVLRAAPIVLEATALTSDGCGPILTVANSQLDGRVLGGGCPGRDAPVGISDQNLLIGILNVPENPGRYALAYRPYQPSLFKDVEPQYVPDNFTGYIDVNVVLSGSLQVCLAPPGLSGPDAVKYFGCDPQFADFGVININVAGVASYYAYDGVIGVHDFQGFSGTSAAAPEPAHLGLAAGAILLFLPLLAQQQRRRTQA